MNLITLDFETYYDKDYSLKKVTTEEYIRSPDFEVIGVSNAELSDWIFNNLQPDQLILEFWNPGEKNSGWVHCSYVEDSPRKQYLRAYRKDGKVKYEPILGKATTI